MSPTKRFISAATGSACSRPSLCPRMSPRFLRLRALVGGKMSYIRVRRVLADAAEKSVRENRANLTPEDVGHVTFLRNRFAFQPDFPRLPSKTAVIKSASISSTRLH
jgi:hypothetical protein